MTEEKEGRMPGELAELLKVMILKQTETNDALVSNQNATTGALADLTLVVQDLAAEVRGTNARLDGLAGEVRATNLRLDTLTIEVTGLKGELRATRGATPGLAALEEQLAASEQRWREREEERKRSEAEREAESKRWEAESKRNMEDMLARIAKLEAGSSKDAAE